MGIESKTDLDIIEDTTHPLHELQQAIAAMPAVDAERVQAVINKLRNGELNMTGTEQERLESAKRIAKQIIDEISNTDE